MIDWSTGTYEHTAAQLEPASELVVRQAATGPGQAVADIACGTGNAALLAARTGAQVTGVDLAPRLVAVARERARQAGLPAAFVVGDASALPLDDAAFDVALSVFGVIFAPAEAAVAELVRVLAPGGRLVLTTWVPAGPIAEIGTALTRARMDAGDGGRPPVDRPAWMDPGALEALLGRHGFTEVSGSEHGLAFEAASPEAYVQDLVDHHPMWRVTAEAVGDARMRELTAAATRTLHERNEDPAGFRSTSRYRLVTATRGAG